MVLVGSTGVGYASLAPTQVVASGEWMANENPFLSDEDDLEKSERVLPHSVL